RPALAARIGAAVALLCVLLTAGWYWRMAGQLASHRAETRYQKFVQHRNEALFYGLVATDQGRLFLGADAATRLPAAESAARPALHLAGVEADSETPAVDPSFPAHRRTEIAADSYTLLLVLASVREGRRQKAEGRKQKAEGPVFLPSAFCLLPSEQKEALRLLDGARKLGFRTRAYHLLRAHLRERMGQQEEAQKERDRARSLPLAGALDYFLIGKEHYRRGEWDKARDQFHRALALQPGHFWAQFLLAVCHLQGQQWEAAKAGLNACLTQQADFI